MLLQDVWFLEKLAHFSREVIPERRMHAKGSGAFGTFKVTQDITRYSKAALFSEVGKETELFARFSTVAGERGAADAERDIRGFALRFYTEEGNWDVVGNNTPVFFHRDPHHFPDLNRAVKRDPRTNLRSAENNWDFWTNLPEALHQITIVMSDRGIPDGYRHMHGFGSHTYSFINESNERFWVKFHFRTQQGIKNLTDEEAAAVVADDRESSQADLFDAIERGDNPKWTFFIQVMPEADAASYRYHPFDLTKVWSKKDYPLIEVGEFELNRNPENYFADVEQAAFTPANFVPGVAASPDRMLQGKLFSYGDAARYRVGVNHHQIPVNQPAVRRTSTPTTATASCVWTATRAPPRLHPEQLRPLGGAAAVRRARSGARRCRGRPVRLPRGRRQLLRAAGQPVPADDPGGAGRPVRQHRPGHRRCLAGHHRASHPPLHAGRPGLRRGCPQGHRGAEGRQVGPKQL